MLSFINFYELPYREVSFQQGKLNVWKQWVKVSAKRSHIIYLFSYGCATYYGTLMNMSKFSEFWKSQWKDNFVNALR